MDRGWCTKEDVIKDLEVLSGRRVPEVQDCCLVVGEQPPPPRVFADEDDEIELQFGQAASTAVLSKDSRPVPDLMGIKQMLRMVQDYEHIDEDTSIAEEIKPYTKIVISKLNPNVSEFVPKSPQSSSSNYKLTKTEDAIASLVTSTAATIDGENDNKKSNNIDSKSSHIENVKAKEDEDSLEIKKEKAIMLKSKMNLKMDTFKEKRDINLAFINLVKLYTKPEQKTREQPVKLYTPHFFENCKASDFVSYDEDALRTKDGSIESMKRSLPIVEEIKNDDTLERNPMKENDDDAVAKTESRNKKNDFLKNKNNNKLILQSQENYDSNEATLLTPDMANTSDKETPLVVIQEPVDKEMVESISKVNNWFENKPIVTASKPQTPKGPALYLGTVVYKRKDSVTCKSPSEILDKKIPKPSNGAYVPSAYADELLTKYKEKSKKMESKLSMWEKLELDLQKKDKEIEMRKRNARLSRSHQVIN